MIYSDLRVVTPGVAKGPIARLTSPLSLWGGLDLTDGSISDVSHPQHGLSLRGKVVAMRAARGSSSSASVLVEASRRGIGPTGIILGQIDSILVIGSLVAEVLYGHEIPIVLFPDAQWDELPVSANVEIVASESSGTLSISTQIGS